MDFGLWTLGELSAGAMEEKRRERGSEGTFQFGRHCGVQRGAREK